MVQINSTDKIETLIGYLQSEIEQLRLDSTLAKMFLYGLWVSRLDNDVILQPKWTFAVSEFKKYLAFYKRYNLLHYGGSQTKFSPDYDLYQSNDVTIEVTDKETIDTILKIGIDIPEFQDFYKIGKA